MANAIKWAADAEERIKKVPFFVRPLARRKAEAAAAERGMAEVTSTLLDEIKAKEMPGSSPR
jgi:light-independent protochlorophyllide reductase subunit B